LYGGLSLKVNKTIALIDSGVGGLSILYQLKKILPNNDFVYFADKKNLPYGNKTQNQLTQIAYDIVKIITNAFEIEIFVLACNTLTAGAIDFLRAKYPNYTFVGCEPNLNAPKIFGKKNPLVLCTPYTKNSQRINSRFGDKANFVETPLLAKMIEEDLPDETICQYLTNIAKDLKAIKYDCIVLGCTHYYLKQDLVSKVFGLPVYTSVEGVSNRVYNLLKQKNAINYDKIPVTCFWQTDKYQGYPSIMHFWNKNLKKI